MSHGHQAEKRLRLDKMQKTRSQKKYRDSDNARKQLYLPLNKQAIKDLQRLADHNQKKDIGIVELFAGKGGVSALGTLIKMPRQGQNTEQIAYGHQTVTRTDKAQK